MSGMWFKPNAQQTERAIRAGVNRATRRKAASMVRSQLRDSEKKLAKLADAKKSREAK